MMNFINFMIGDYLQVYRRAVGNSNKREENVEKIFLNKHNRRAFFYIFQSKGH
jgi:hypothetical protein